jgi:hypothetical protein
MSSFRAQEASSWPRLSRVICVRCHIRPFSKLRALHQINNLQGCTVLHTGLISCSTGTSIRARGPIAQLLAASGTPSYHELRTLLPPNKTYQVRLASVEPRTSRRHVRHNFVTSEGEIPVQCLTTEPRPDDYKLSIRWFTNAEPFDTRSAPSQRHSTGRTTGRCSHIDGLQHLPTMVIENVDLRHSSTQSRPSNVAVSDRSLAQKSTCLASRNSLKRQSCGLTNCIRQS